MNSNPNVDHKAKCASLDFDVRKDEEDKFWFRSDRFFMAEQKWYFTTRENRDVGPYKSRADAEHGLELFIDSIANQYANLEHAIAIATKGDWAVCLYH